MNDWASIIERHGPLVWSISHRLLGRGADAEECFQETFLAALKLGRRQEVRDWKALLRQLAVRCASQLLRQRYRRQRDHDLPPQGVATRPEADPAARVMREESIEQVRQALAKLTPRQAEVFWLRFVEEMPYQDIAVQLGLRVGAVGVLVHKVRMRMRELTRETLCPRGGP